MTLRRNKKKLYFKILNFLKVMHYNIITLKGVICRKNIGSKKYGRAEFLKDYAFQSQLLILLMSVGD